MSLNVGYVGSHSTHVVTFRNFNQPLPGTGDPSTWAPDDATGVRLPPVTAPSATPRPTRVANYNGLQVSLRRGGPTASSSSPPTPSARRSRQPGFYGAGLGRLQR